MQNEAGVKKYCCDAFSTNEGDLEIEDNFKINILERNTGLFLGLIFANKQLEAIQFVLYVCNDY